MAKKQVKKPSRTPPLTSSVRPAPRISKRFRTTAEDWVLSGTWAGVISSNVSAIKYDLGKKELHILFDHGTVYVYSAIEPTTAKGCYNSNSIGRWVHFTFVKEGVKGVTYPGGTLVAAFRSLAET